MHRIILFNVILLGYPYYTRRFILCLRSLAKRFELLPSESANNEGIVSYDAVSLYQVVVFVSSLHAHDPML